ncbi:hypothetical protein CHELA20_10309 [Hyphomicrobiales bacterium]|nr:hypothetical protein CHELA20_10309 [Hyphomicrobiales bacterium]
MTNGTSHCCCSSSRSARPPATPRQKLPMEMPRMMAFGATADTRRMAAGRSGPICATTSAWLASEVNGVFGMSIRATWLLTPRTRIASISGCVLELKAGTRMPMRAVAAGKRAIGDLSVDCFTYTHEKQ